MAIEIKAALAAMESLSSAIEDMGAAMAAATVGMASKNCSPFDSQQSSTGSTLPVKPGLPANKKPQFGTTMLPTHLLDNPGAISTAAFQRYSTTEYRRAAEMHEHIAKWLQMHSLQTGAAVDHKISMHKQHAATFEQLARSRMTRLERLQGVYGSLGGHAGALNALMMMISLPPSLGMLWKMLPTLLSWLLRFPSHSVVMEHVLPK